MKHIIGKNDEDLQSFYMDWEEMASHLLVGGSFQSGRTSLLRTIILSLAYTYSPEELHIVLVDASGRSLNDLDKLPHVIAWVNGEDAFAENIAHLRNELNKRREKREENSPEIFFVFDDYDLAADAMGINEKILLELGKNIRQDSDLGFHFLVSLLGSTHLRDDSLIKQLKLLRVGISLGNTETLEALGAYITSSMRKEQLPPGRGYFFVRNKISLIQFANPNNPSKDEIIQTVIRKWSGCKKAKWKNPASEEQIEQVKNDSAADIGALNSNQGVGMLPDSDSSYVNMEESVKLYMEQQNKLKSGEA